MITIRVLLAVFTIAIVRIEGNCNNSPAEDLLMRLKEISKFVLTGCAIVNHNNFSKTYYLLKNCLEKRAISNLDRLFNKEVIEVSKAIKLVKIANNSNITRKSRNIVLENNEKKNKLDQFLKIFQTHAGNINLAKFIDCNSTAVVEARRRRHRRQNMMGPLMMFGFIAMLMILIPMGFKFLTVLGAKALLLAKMALILTSIQGLKKFATSGVNYGFYQAPPPNHFQHDRHGYLESPSEDQLESYNHYQRS